MTPLERVRAEIEKHTDGKNHCDEYLDGYNDGMKDALEIIDRYAEQEPPKNADLKEIFCMDCEYKEQEPCDDVVSRDMALEKMADYVASGYADSVEDFEEYSRIICQLPSVRPQEQIGHWIEYNKVIFPAPINSYEQAWKCSKCGNDGFIDDNYCPNCGARMESEDKE